MEERNGGHVGDRDSPRRPLKSSIGSYRGFRGGKFTSPRSRGGFSSRRGFRGSFRSRATSFSSRAKFAGGRGGGFISRGNGVGMRRSSFGDRDGFRDKPMDKFSPRGRGRGRGAGRGSTFRGRIPRGGRGGFSRYEDRPEGGLFREPSPIYRDPAPYDRFPPARDVVDRGYKPEMRLIELESRTSARDRYFDGPMRGDFVPRDLSPRRLDYEAARRDMKPYPAGGYPSRDGDYMGPARVRDYPRRSPGPPSLPPSAYSMGSRDRGYSPLAERDFQASRMRDYRDGREMAGRMPMERPGGPLESRSLLDDMRRPLPGGRSPMRYGTPPPHHGISRMAKSGGGFDDMRLLPEDRPGNRYGGYGDGRRGGFGGRSPSPYSRGPPMLSDRGSRAPPSGYRSPPGGYRDGGRDPLGRDFPPMRRPMPRGHMDSPPPKRLRGVISLMSRY